jgi:NADH-quinone oxidoreductase E subunit
MKKEQKAETLELTQKKCRKELTEEIATFIDQCMKEDHSDSQLIAVLHKIQKQCGYISQEKMECVAQMMQIPASKISGVVTFYHFFRTKPQGKYLIQVCTGTACHVKGADLVAQKVQDHLGIKYGETTSDGLFTLESTRCLGTCALAPVVKIEEDVYPHVTPDQIPTILQKYFDKGQVKG